MSVLCQMNYLANFKELYLYLAFKSQYFKLLIGKCLHRHSNGNWENVTIK